jgi:hypothetical protein
VTDAAGIVCFDSAGRDVPLGARGGVRYAPFAPGHASEIGKLLHGIGWEERFVTGQLDAIAGFAADAERSRVLVALAIAVNDTPKPTVTDFGGWGKWVNGGAWLTVRGQRVDFIYRSVERLGHWIGESARGEFAQDYYVQDAYGFRSYVYLGELSICRPLYDPEGVLVRLKAQVETYPPALKRALIRTWLPVSRRSFYSLRKAAARGDAYMAVGCLTRIVAMLTQVLFALNEIYFVSDKGALERIDAFALRPKGYAQAVRELLGRAGTAHPELTAAARRLEALHAEVAALCAEWLPERDALESAAPHGGRRSVVRTTPSEGDPE